MLLEPWLPGPWPQLSRYYDGIGGDTGRRRHPLGCDLNKKAAILIKEHEAASSNITRLLSDLWFRALVMSSV
jgi:hypothetical protein